MAKLHDRFEDCLGDIIRKLREEKGLTREELAEKVGVSGRHVASVERGERLPSFSLLRRIMICLDVSADRIFFSEHPAVEPSSERFQRLIVRCTPEQQRLIADFADFIIKKGYMS